MTRITTHHGIFKNTALHVDDYGGSGRPIVLIHGWPLSGESFKPQIPALIDAGYRPITYDRRGFGGSDRPASGYDYNSLADDLHVLLTALDLTDVTLVGFSMGGGEVARYATKYANQRVHSVVFASAVPPYLLKTDDNPQGPLTKAEAEKQAAALTANPDFFYRDFLTKFFSAGDVMKATAEQLEEAYAICKQASKQAALECMAAFAFTDFRDDLTNVIVPTLVLHGDADMVVPFEGSGRRTHEAIVGSELVVLADAPHGCNTTNAREWNEALVSFLGHVAAAAPSQRLRERYSPAA